MKSKYLKNYSVVIIFVLFTFGCSKDIELPTVRTFEAPYSTQTTVPISGKIVSEGGSNIIKWGVCWGINPNPVIADNSIEFNIKKATYSDTIKNLTQHTTYYARVYGVNSGGTSYGNEISFSTLPETISDIDGNAYGIVRIGSQVWMAENLKTTKYRNGDEIPNMEDSNTWFNTSDGAYCTYNNDFANFNRYGALYNMAAVNDSRDISPEGWHIPTFDEWMELEILLGGSEVAGGKMKEKGTTHWLAPNTTTNESNFTALPGGYRYKDFNELGMAGAWWIKNEKALLLQNYTDEIFFLNAQYQSGCSVRCIMD